jgi:hypothetical protein
VATETLAVKLLLDANQYKSQATQAATATGKISKEAQIAGTQTRGLQNRMAGFGSMLRGAAVVGGVLALGRGLISAGQAAEEAASIMANTNQIIQQTGGVANVTADDVSELSGRLAALTGVEDEVVQEGANVLLTFKGIRNEVGEGNDVFDRTAGLMLDISAVMGTDAKSAALQLGKALNDPVSNMGALTRAGLTFTQGQKDQIRNLVASNDLLGAQRLILDELESQLGGTAAASAKATDKIKSAFGEIVEAGGKLLLPVFEDIAVELQNIAGLTDELDRVAAHAGGAAESAAAFLTVIAEQTGGAGFFNAIGRGIETFIGGLVPGISHMERFRDTLEELAPRLSIPELLLARDGIKALGAEMGLTSSEIELVSEILDAQLRKAATDAAEATHEIGLEMRGLKKRTPDVKELTTSTEALASAAERSADAAKRQREEYVKQRDALRNVHNPLFRMVELNDDLTEAQDNVTEASKKGITSKEYRDAVLDRARIIADLESTFIELKTQGIDPTGAAARLMLEGLGLPPGVINEIISEFDRLERDFESRTFRATVSFPTFAGKEVIVRTSTAIYRQHGGPVTAGGAYVVGEAGRELFIPNKSGTIVSNDQLNSGGTMGGSTMNVFVLTWDDFVRKTSQANVDISRYGW